MSKALGIAKVVLMVWGAISLIGVLVLVGFFAYSFKTDDSVKYDKATAVDVQFVFGWSDIPFERLERVVHSYEGRRYFNGDYNDVYAIQLTDISVDELVGDTTDPVAITSRFYRGDQLPSEIENAVDYQYIYINDSVEPWFPSVKEIRSDQMYVFAFTVNYSAGRIDKTELVFVRPSDKMLYFFGAAE